MFNQVHSKNLVYNTCWEDPACDRQLLNFDADSNIVMITSAGCNALDYLLDNPNNVHCIDMNPRQNALLQLKVAAFKNGNFDRLFQLFGQGKCEDAKEFYQEELRRFLPEFAQKYWDKNIKFFNGKGLRKSFYHYGSSGTFAWLSNRYLKARKKLYRQVQQMFDAETLEEQASIYYQIEGRILNPLVGWVVNRHLTMSLVGVPRAQQQLFVDKYEKGALGYIQECLRKVFTELPLSRNYFWRLYLDGAYTEDCCPSYLAREHFNTLADRIDNVHTYTTTISDFLKKNPGPYSHFILLDHQDWLAAHNVPALEEEWRLIMQNSRPGTKILLRSAAATVDFFPDFIHDRIEFEQEMTRQTHQQDRVGTYASVYMGIVK